MQVNYQKLTRNLTCTSICEKNDRGPEPRLAEYNSGSIRIGQKLVGGSRAAGQGPVFGKRFEAKRSEYIAQSPSGQKNNSTIHVQLFICSPPLRGVELNTCEINGEHNMNACKLLF